MPTSPAPDLHGLWVPLVTPYDNDDRVDARALDRLARRVLRDGARGIVALGTTGEPDVLRDHEQRLVIETCAGVCAELDRPLLVGVGTNCTRTTIDASQAVADVPGVTGTLVVVPYYTRPTSAAVVEHYRVVAAESPLPVVAYNIPYRTGRALDVGDVVAITHVANVVGLKQSVGSFDADTLRILRDAPAGFHLYSGDDAFIAPTLLLGGAGAIAACAHVCTPQFAALVTAGRDGDVMTTRRLAARLLDVVEAGFAEPNPALWKAALHAAGEIATPGLRPPMRAAGSGSAQRLLHAIHEAEVSGRAA